MIQQGADVKAKDSANKMNALTKACVLYDDADFKRVKKRISIATLLIEHGVDINQFVNTSTQSALDNATLFKFEEMKQLLLEKGAKYRTLSVARPFFTFFSSYQLQGGVNATDVSVASYH